MSFHGSYPNFGDVARREERPPGYPQSQASFSHGADVRQERQAGEEINSLDSLSPRPPLGDTAPSNLLSRTDMSSLLEMKQKGPPPGLDRVIIGLCSDRSVRTGCCTT